MEGLANLPDCNRGAGPQGNLHSAHKIHRDILYCIVIHTLKGQAFQDLALRGSRAQLITGALTASDNTPPTALKTSLYPSRSPEIINTMLFNVI